MAFPMRILIFGGDGMLGHQLWESWHARHDVWVTLRKDGPAYAARSEAFRADRSPASTSAGSGTSWTPSPRSARTRWSTPSAS